MRKKSIFNEKRGKKEKNIRKQNSRPVKKHHLFQFILIQDE